MAAASEKAGSSRSARRTGVPRGSPKRHRRDPRRRGVPQALSADPLSDFFPSDFYARLVRRFPDVDRFAGLNGDGTRREYALYDERSDPGSEEGRRAVEHRAPGPVVAGDRLGAAGEAGRGVPHPRQEKRRGLADPDAPAPRALHRPQRLRDQAPSRHPPEGPHDADLPAPGREPARTRHGDLQGFADGRVRLEILWPRQGEDDALPAEFGLRLRRHPPGLFALEIELARARGDLGSRGEAAAFRSSTPITASPRPSGRRRCEGAGRARRRQAAGQGPVPAWDGAHSAAALR